MNNPKIKALEDMSEEELDAKLEKGYQQALRKEGKPCEVVFAELEKDLL